MTTKPLSLVVLGFILFTLEARAGQCIRNQFKLPRICDVRGYSSVSSTFFTSNQTVESIAQCADLTFFTSTYKSFGYNETSKLCHLIDTHIKDRQGHPQVKPNPESDTIFYDRRCFDCVPTCPQPTDGSNLLYNGGFEHSPQYIGPWTGAFPIVTPGHNSKQAISLSEEVNSEYYSGEIIQAHKVCPDQEQTYYLSFDYKYVRGPPGTDTHPTVLIRTKNFFLNIPLKRDNLNDTWTSVKYSMAPFPVRKDSYVEADIVFNNGRKTDHFFLDNVRIVAVPKAAFPPATTGKNFFVNGGFDTGVLSPWKSQQPFGKPARIVPASRLYGGDTSLGNKYALVPGQGEHGFLQIRQRVFGLTPHKPYLISFDYKADLTLATPTFYIFTHGGDSFYPMSGFQNNTKASVYWVYTPFREDTSFTFQMSGSGYSSIVVDSFAIREVA